MKMSERCPMPTKAKDVVPCPPIPLRRSGVKDCPEGSETFTFGRFRFDFVAQDEFSLPRYKGSVFRGGFGLALKRVSCSPQRRTPCASCILGDECAYARVFETPVRPGDTGMIEGMSDAPHPLVLRPPMSTRQLYRPRDPFDIEIILVGKALRFLPHVICAFEDFSRMGFGPGKGRFEMRCVSAFVGGEWKRIYSCDERRLEPLAWTLTGVDQIGDSGMQRVDRVELKALTPIRIKADWAITDNLSFDLLMKNILRRMEMVDSLHCEGKLRFDHERLLALSAHV